MQPITLPHHHSDEFKTSQLKAYMDNNLSSFGVVANVFKQLSDPTRVRIFWLLCHCEECVLNISAMMEMSSPAVSHHLRQLKDNSLIVSRREGKEVYYRAASTEQAQLLHLMIERAMAITCPE